MRKIWIKNETDKIKKWEGEIKRKDLLYKTNKYKNNFQQYEMIRSFGESIYTDKINIDEAKMDQNNLIENMLILNEKSRSRKKQDKERKKYF